MARADREVRKVIEGLGIEVVREIAGKPEATDEEVWQLVKHAARNVKRRIEIIVSVIPYQNGEERLERVMDMLNRPQKKGGNDADNNQ